MRRSCARSAARLHQRRQRNSNALSCRDCHAHRSVFAASTISLRRSRGRTSSGVASRHHQAATGPRPPATLARNGRISGWKCCASEDTRRHELPCDSPLFGAPPGCEPRRLARSEHDRARCWRCDWWRDHFCSPQRSAPIRRTALQYRLARSWSWRSVGRRNWWRDRITVPLRTVAARHPLIRAPATF